MTSIAIPFSRTGKATTSEAGKISQVVILSGAAVSQCEAAAQSKDPCVLRAFALDHAGNASSPCCAQEEIANFPVRMPVVPRTLNRFWCDPLAGSDSLETSVRSRFDHHA